MGPFCPHSACSPGNPFPPAASVGFYALFPRLLHGTDRLAVLSQDCPAHHLSCSLALHTQGEPAAGPQGTGRTGGQRAARVPSSSTAPPGTVCRSGQGLLLQPLLQQPGPFAETISGSVRRADQHRAGCRRVKYCSGPCCPVVAPGVKERTDAWLLLGRAQHSLISVHPTALLPAVPCFALHHR